MQKLHLLFVNSNVFGSLANPWQRHQSAAPGKDWELGTKVWKSLGEFWGDFAKTRDSPSGRYVLAVLIQREYLCLIIHGFP